MSHYQDIWTLFKQAARPSAEGPNKNETKAADIAIASATKEAAVTAPAKEAAPVSTEVAAERTTEEGVP